MVPHYFCLCNCQFASNANCHLVGRVAVLANPLTAENVPNKTFFWTVQGRVAESGSTLAARLAFTDVRICSCNVPCENIVKLRARRETPNNQNVSVK